MKLNSPTFLLITVLSALAVSAALADEEQALIQVLQADVAAPGKCDACQRLRLIGTVKSVPALAALLNQPATAHAARYALEGMPFPQALAALRQAAGTTSGPSKAGLIDSLGWRRDADAVPLLVNALSDADPVVAS